jgi:hypothetical protein
VAAQLAASDEGLSSVNNKGIPKLGALQIILNNTTEIFLNMALMI